MSMFKVAGLTDIPIVFINDVQVVGVSPLDLYVMVIEELFAR